jgi:hypothetical protein
LGNFRAMEPTACNAAKMLAASIAGAGIWCLFPRLGGEFDPARVVIRFDAGARPQVAAVGDPPRNHPFTAYTGTAKPIPAQARNGL